jgi:hypothetical protein
MNLVVCVKLHAYPDLQSKISHVWPFIGFGCIITNWSSKHLEGPPYLEWTTVRTNKFSVFSVIYLHFTILQFNTSLYELITYMYLFVNVVRHRLTREKLNCSPLLRIQDKIKNVAHPHSLLFAGSYLAVSQICGFAPRIVIQSNFYNVERDRTVCVCKLVLL